MQGDFVVVGGNLYLQPGASIHGRAIAIGGGVYGSTLASVTGGTRSFRDRTFDATRTADGIRLAHRNLAAHDPRFELPLLDGARIPSYDRVDGASLAWGPLLRPTARLEIEPTITYRSHIGEWDPGLHALVRPGEIWRLTIDGRRVTVTRCLDQLGPINSGQHDLRRSDKRNYYIADRYEAALGRIDRTPTVELERMRRGAYERAWSVGSPDTIGSRPWTVLKGEDIDNVRRGNPAIEPGRSRQLFGASIDGAYGDVTAGAWRASKYLGGSRRADSSKSRRTKRSSFDISAPAPGRTSIIVTTPGDTAPPSDSREAGRRNVAGDPRAAIAGRRPIAARRCALRDSTPSLTIPWPRNALIISLRHRIGAAGVQDLPRFIQNLGATASLSFVRIEYAIDPATRQDHFGVVFSFTR